MPQIVPPRAAGAPQPLLHRIRAMAARLRRELPENADKPQTVVVKAAVDWRSIGKLAARMADAERRAARNAQIALLSTGLFAIGAHAAALWFLL